MPVAPSEKIRDLIGSEVGVSGWLTMNQQQINEFAEATEDRQFIHTDPEAAAQTPFSGAINSS